MRISDWSSDVCSSDLALPLGLERGHVDDDPAAGVGALAQAHHQHVARDAEELDRASQRERIGRDDAHVRLDVDEAARVERLGVDDGRVDVRSEEHTSELQSLMRISYAVSCLKKKKTYIKI